MDASILSAYVRGAVDLDEHVQKWGSEVPWK